jgi:hypothetical protein
MASIYEIVKEVLTNGYLSKEKFTQIEILLRGDYSKEDLQALIKLEQAIIDGRIKSEPSQAKQWQQVKTRPGIVKMKLVCQTAMAAAIVATVVFRSPQTNSSNIISPDTGSTSNKISQ